MTSPAQVSLVLLSEYGKTRAGLPGFPYEVSLVPYEVSLVPYEVSLVSGGRTMCEAVNRQKLIIRNEGDLRTRETS